MDPIFFNNRSDLRNWFLENSGKESELIVGYYKVDSGKAGITWSQSVDEAICFGWIDGIRHSIDKESYCNRFTPRNPKSIWSDVNIKKAEELIRLGLMSPQGLKLFSNRKIDRSGLYSYENKPEILPPEFEERFKANKEAWDYFLKQPPSYRKTIYFWVLSAKQESTRLSRLERVILKSQQKTRHF
jgi:uncharacterized protein YdeI (YjbR/CyaY-like superfamily)